MGGSGPRMVPTDKIIGTSAVKLIIIVSGADFIKFSQTCANTGD